KNKFGYDDTLDVFGVHGLGGTWGAIATGIFASTLVNSTGANGLVHGGGFTLLGHQLAAVGITMVYAPLMTFIIVSLLKPIMGIRVKEENEVAGLDVSEHGETGYAGPEQLLSAASALEG